MGARASRALPALPGAPGARASCTGQPRPIASGEQVGFNADHDHTVSEERRFVQLTPRGSACSIAIGRGITDARLGSVTGLFADPDGNRWSVQQLPDRG